MLNCSINYSKNAVSFIKSFENHPKNCQTLFIQQCPSTAEAIKLISRLWFREKIKKTEIILIVFQINEHLCDKNFQPVEICAFEKPLLISIESSLKEDSKILYWKNSKSNKFYCEKFLNNASECLFNFVREFIMEYVVDNQTGAQCGSKFDSNNFHPQIYQLQDANGYNMLMRAVENENIEIVRQLLKYPFDVNRKHERSGRKAIDIAFDKGNNDIIYCLLKANSTFPTNFYSDEVDGKVRDFIRISLEIHDAVIRNDKEKAKKILRNNEGLRHFYDLKNNSVATTALKYKRIKIYNMLIKNSICIGPNENINEIFQQINESEEPKLKIRRLNENVKFIHDENAKSVCNKHLLTLIANSCIGHDDQKSKSHSKLIQNAFEFLDKDLMIKPILKVVAASKNFKIHFDFNRTSILFMDPTSSDHENGTCYYTNGQIYIAAKDLLCTHKEFDAYGVIAHELCHYALHLTYRNSCKPFSADDHLTAEQLNEIFERCWLLKHEEKLIADVFKYKEKFQIAELAVRVPQLIAKYSNNLQKLQDLCEIFRSLFVFFEQEILPKLHESILALDKIASTTVSWGDLTNSLKSAICHSAVIFQGNIIKFIEIIQSKHDDILKCLSSQQICKILNGELIQVFEVDVIKTTFYVERNFINKKSNIKVDMNGIISECEAFNVIMLSDQAGSGKTTTFRHIVRVLKEKHYKSSWISFIDLKRHLIIYKRYENCEWNIGIILKFLIEIIGINEELDIQIFKNLFNDGKIILLWDGVDEISPIFKDFIVNLMVKMRQISTNKQFISTRPQHTDYLEMMFQRDAYKFCEYNKCAKLQFVREVLRDKTIKETRKSMTNQNEDIQFENFQSIPNENQQIEEISKFLESLEKNSIDSINNPLILQMITELHVTEGNKFAKLNLYSIFDAIIEKKKKILTTKGEISNNDRDINSKLNIWQVHQIYALKLIFRTGFVDVTCGNNSFVDLNKLSIMKKWKTQHQKWTPEIIARYGILIIDNWRATDQWGISWEFPDFIHRTFAEFFAAQYLIESIYDEDDEDISENEMELRLKLLFCVFFNNREFCQIAKFISNFIDLQDMNEEKIFCELIHKLLSKNGSHKIFASKLFIQNKSLLTSLWNTNGSSSETLFQRCLKDENVTFNYFLDVLKVADETFGDNWPKITGYVKYDEKIPLLSDKETEIFRDDATENSSNQKTFIKFLDLMEKKFPNHVEQNFLQKYFSEMFLKNFMTCEIFQTVFHRIVKLFEDGKDSISEIVIRIIKNPYNFIIYQNEKFVNTMWTEIQKALDQKSMKKILLHNFQPYEHPMLTIFRVQNKFIMEFYINLYRKYCEIQEIQKIFIPESKDHFFIEISSITKEKIENFQEFLTEIFLASRSSQNEHKMLLVEFFKQRDQTGHTFLSYLKENITASSNSSDDKEKFLVLNNLARKVLSSDEMKEIMMKIKEK